MSKNKSEQIKSRARRIRAATKRHGAGGEANWDDGGAMEVCPKCGSELWQDYNMELV